MKPRSVSMNVDSGEKTWLTPPNIISALGPFDLDPCCPPDMPWPTAKRMVSLPENGLAVDWTGQCVWLNPPYGRDALPFLRKMAENRTGGGYIARICANGYVGVAGLDIPMRIRHTLSSRTHQVLQGGRNARRDVSRAICAYRVHGTGFHSSLRQRSCRCFSTHWEA